MRREGRPHGMVRTYHALPSPLNPKPPSRVINKIDSPPTAGLFTKISGKPTNHSKFTGKCEKARCSGCHLHPASKSKQKSKGFQKVRTADAAVSYQQVTWGVTGSGNNKLRNDGYSASDVLDHLEIDYNHLRDYDYDDNASDEDDDDMQLKCESLIECVKYDNDDDVCDVANAVVNSVIDNEEGWSIVGVNDLI